MSFRWACEDRRPPPPRPTLPSRVPVSRRWPPGDGGAVRTPGISVSEGEPCSCARVTVAITQLGQIQEVSFRPSFADQRHAWVSHTIKWFFCSRLRSGAPLCARSFTTLSLIITLAPRAPWVGLVEGVHICVCPGRRSVTSPLVPTLGSACTGTLASRRGISSRFPSRGARVGAGANDVVGVRARSAGQCSRPRGLCVGRFSRVSVFRGWRRTVSSRAGLLGAGVPGLLPRA